jgi:glycosyltransferase involved in cell wall biosynthesis
MRVKTLLVGPFLSRSGYGRMARFALESLSKHEDKLDLYLIDIPWGASGKLWKDSEERRRIIDLLRKTEMSGGLQRNQFDLSVQVTIPNEFKNFAKVNIGYTAGIETNKVDPVWVQFGNMMNKLVVISEHSKESYENTHESVKDQFGNEVQLKLQTPVDVVNFGYTEVETEDLELDLKYDNNFLLVSQYGPRKNIDNAISWFLEAMHDQEVGLVVKTHGRRNSRMDYDRLSERFKSLKENYKDCKCELTLLHGSLTNGQMRSLYLNEKIKALVNLSHGEGFGLPMFEAACEGLPVITPFWSGQCDFLSMPVNKGGRVKHKAMVPRVAYDLGPVSKDALWEGVIREDSMWCYPNKGSYMSRLNEMLKDYPRFKTQAKKLQAYLLENFKEDDKLEEFSQSVLDTVSDMVKHSQKQASFDYDLVSTDALPKISFITSVYNGEEYFEGFMEDITSQTIFKEKCELIMVDCNSEQNEKELVKPWIEKYPDNIKYITLDKDPGIYAAWNIAIKEANGEFISNANLDDRHSLEFAEKLGKFLFAHKDIDCAYTENYQTFKPNETFENNSANNKTYPVEEFSKEAMLRRNPLHCMPMWRRSLHDENGYFLEDYRSASDWEFWLRCCFESGAKYKKLNEKLGLYYFNPKGISTNSDNNNWKDKEELEIFQKYKKRESNE